MYLLHPLVGRGDRYVKVHSKPSNCGFIRFRYLHILQVCLLTWDFFLALSFRLRSLRDLGFDFVLCTSNTALFFYQPFVLQKVFSLKQKYLPITLLTEIRV